MTYYEELYILSKALTGPTRVWADAITSGGHKGRMCQKLTATNSFMAGRTKLLSSEEGRRIHEERVQMYRRARPGCLKVTSDHMLLNFS